MRIARYCSIAFCIVGLLSVPRDVYAGFEGRWNTPRHGPDARV